MNNIILELNDVNLSNFFLELEENKIIIEILNMTDGNEVCTIIIENIISLKYTNEIDNNDILPTYIGELTILQNPPNE